MICRFSLENVVSITHEQNIICSKTRLDGTHEQPIICRSRICHYYSTNCNTIQIWSTCSRYLSSVGNRYPAVYLASYVGRKREVRKCRQRDLKMLGCFFINLLNNKSIILLNLVEYHLIFANSAYGLIG